MTALSIKFDPISYSQKLRNVGVSSEQADLQAQTIEQVINDIATSQDLATKTDLLIALKEQELRLIKWTLGTGVAVIMAIAGLLKYVVR